MQAAIAVNTATTPEMKNDLGITIRLHLKIRPIGTRGAAVIPKTFNGIPQLRRRFKFVVIDSPPIMAATDAVILSALTDGVLLVVRSGQTPKEAFTRTRDLLAAVKGRLLGVVLNGVDSSAPDYYYSYRYYPYAYGYGYGEDVAKSSPIPMGSDKDEHPSS